jgi:hypothetical protein
MARGARNLISIAAAVPNSLQSNTAPPFCIHRCLLEVVFTVVVFLSAVES